MHLLHTGVRGVGGSVGGGVGGGSTGPTTADGCHRRRPSARDSTAITSTIVVIGPATVLASWQKERPLQTDPRHHSGTIRPTRSKPNAWNVRPVPLRQRTAPPAASSVRGGGGGWGGGAPIMDDGCHETTTSTMRPGGPSFSHRCHRLATGQPSPQPNNPRYQRDLRGGRRILVH